MCEWKTIISVLIKGGLHVLFFKLSTIFDKTQACFVFAPWWPSRDRHSCTK